MLSETSEEMYEKENEVFGKENEVFGKENEVFEIYTHNEHGEETEFEIRDMDGFLANNSKYLDKLVKELESKVAFQRDLKYAVDHDMVQCFDSATGENLTSMDTDYLQSAITANLRTITRIRTHLGWDPEPVIANDTAIRMEHYKSKREMN